jgi:hypothetical protein
MSETLEGVMSALSPALVHKKVPTNYRTAEGSKKFKGAHMTTYNSTWTNSGTEPSYMTGMIFYELESKACEIYRIFWIHMETFHFRR